MFFYFIAVVLVANTIADPLSDNGNCNDAINLAVCRSMANNGVSVLPSKCDELEELTLPQFVRSCKDILGRNSSATSGYYNIHLSDGTIKEEYCEMDGSNCDNTGGWKRIGLIDLNQSGTSCPEGFVERTSLSNNIRTCGSVVPAGTHEPASPQCRSMFFHNFDSNYQYEKVCGRIRGYQYGTPDGFSTSGEGIDGTYLWGFSITQKTHPRKHIWSYVAGKNTKTGSFYNNCPCNTGNTAAQLPSFIENHYYCESGTDEASASTFYPDVLWDGRDCAASENECCMVSPNLPWFNKTLDFATTDDIEIRACQKLGLANEGVFFDLIELYIK